MANLLVIEKQTGGYFKFTLNGDTATAVTSIKNDLLAVGTQLHFKTGNGANIIKEQFIYPEDVTIISGGTFTFTTVAQVWNKLIEIDYFAWLGNGGAGGVSRFDDLADTFEYVGQAGKVVVVDNSELKLIPVTFYNKRLFTDLEDTPNSLVPNKMVVVNPEGSALILQDQPQAPEQLLNSVGYFDYNDLATQTTPLDAVTNVPLKLVNDTEGANTNTSENPYGVSYVWDYTTNQFNFSELSIGDTIDIRIHVQVTTTTANQKVNLDAKFGIGSVSEFTNSIYENQFKTAGLHEINFVAPFYMGSTYITDYPAELYLTTDASATVKVNGWYVRIIRKNINIITVDYEVPDATTLAKGIVRLAGDLGGTANSPTVPGLANKVPTSRIIETTSPLLGGGALTSDLVLSIQQANSVQSGYLSFADWSTFNNKANDAAVVHLAGTETITGLKTFSSDLNVSDLYVNGYSGFSGRLSLKQANSVAFSGIGYTTVNALGTSALSINFRQTDGTNKTMQINANLIGAAARVFQFPDADGTVALTSQLHNAVTIGTANGLSLSTQVLSLGLASASTNGALSSTDWNTFNNKQNALTNPITGSGTTNYISKFTGASSLGNSLIYDNGTNVGIGTTSPTQKLSLVGANTTPTLAGNEGTFSVLQGAADYGIIMGTKSNGNGWIQAKRVDGTATAYNLELQPLGGNVGIGTTSPLTALTVSGNLSLFTTNQIRLYNSAKNNWTQVDSPLLSGDTEVDFRVLTKTGNFYINASGNVGIGTTTALTGGGTGKWITLQGTAAYSGGIIGAINGVAKMYVYSESGFAKLQGASGEGVRLDVNGGTAALTALSSGNVGIGTTAPAQKLDVVGNIRISNTTPTQEFFSTGNGDVWGSIYSQASGTGSGASLVFSTKRDGNSATDKMIITQGGNVGIGTTSPNYSSSGRTVVDINGTSQSMLALSVGGVGKSFLFYTGTDLLVSNESNGAIKFNTNGSEKAIITSSGNVGIGTTSPSTICHLYKASFPILTIQSSSYQSSLGIDTTSGNLVLNNESNAPLSFNTNATERMRITSGGDVFIGATSAANVEKLGVTYNSQDRLGFVLNDTYTGAGVAQIAIQFRRNGSAIGSITTTTTTTSYNITSDYRLKEDFRNYSGLDLISKIKTYDYKWKKSEDRMFGVKAHELQEVVPYAVTGEKDAEQMQSVDYSKLVPILVQAIKELKTEIETLKK